MLALVGERELVRHVVRSHQVYLVPRSDGRIVVGSTLEEAGFDKRVEAGTIRRLHQAALQLVPGWPKHAFRKTGRGCGPGLQTGCPCSEPVRFRDIMLQLDISATVYC